MFRHLIAIVVFICALFAQSLFGQTSVSPENLGHKVWAVVPLIGTGKPDDPRRPMFVPGPKELSAQPAPNSKSKTAPPPDLLGYTMQMSDDGKSALVEFTFSSPVAFHNFLVKAAARPEVNAATAEREIDLDKLNRGDSDGSEISNLQANTKKSKDNLEGAVAGLRLFERGKSTEGEILTEFRKKKGDFKFSGGDKPAVAAGVAQ